MLEQKTIDGAEAVRVLRQSEGHFLDLKRVEVGPAKLSQSISAFANTAGGELFVGVGEDGPRRFWSGFVTMEDANGLFQVIDQMTALGNHYSATWLTTAGRKGHVLHLVVPKTVDIVYATDGSAYVRRNAQNLRVSGEEAMRRLRLDKGIVSFEDETVNVSADIVNNSAATIKFILDVIPSAEPDEWMRKQNLICDGRPIVAAVLLFADEPQSTLPKRSAIKLLRYQTREREGGRDQLVFDPITVEGPLSLAAARGSERRAVPGSTRMVGMVAGGIGGAR